MSEYVFKKRRNRIAASVIDALGSWMKWLPKPKHTRYKNILIIRLDHVGDMLPATALPKILKEYFPKARIHFLAASWSAPLLENNLFIDELFIYDAPWFSRKRYPRAGRINFLKTVAKLRNRKIDLALSLRGDLRENLLATLIGAKERIGFGSTGGGFLLTKEIDYPKQAHHTERIKLILNSLDVHPSSLDPQIYFSKEETHFFKEKFQRCGVLFNPKPVCLHIDAGSTAKEWPVEHFSALVQKIGVNAPDCQVLLVGSNVEKAKKIQNANLDVRVADLTGRTSLRELCFLLQNSRVTMGADSGPAHISAALNTPTLFLFSGTNLFDEWKPLYDNALVLRRAVDCSPCGLEKCNVKGHPCMEMITPDQVFEKLKDYLF